MVRLATVLEQSPDTLEAQGSPFLWSQRHMYRALARGLGVDWHPAQSIYLDAHQDIERSRYQHPTRRRRAASQGRGHEQRHGAKRTGTGENGQRHRETPRILHYRAPRP